MKLAGTQRIIISVLSLLLAVVALLGVVDDLGKQYTDASFKRALVTFGVARGLNGVISVVQGTEVAMEPAGVGVIFAPGQILDPVNDLVERFSWVMLASTTSLGLQGLMLKMLASKGYSWLVVLVVVIAVWLLWRPRGVPLSWRRRVYHLAAILMILRFLIPGLAISGEAFYRLFLASEYEASSEQLNQTRNILGRLQEEDRQGDTVSQTSSWYESLQRNFRTTLDTMNVDKKVEALQAAVADISEHMINLIVVFIVQTVLFPLFFLWLAARVVRLVIRLR